MAARKPQRATPRERLRTAALALLRAHGPRDITPTALARAARMQQPNFYTYYRSADECLADAAEELAAKLSAANAAGFERVRAAIATQASVEALNREYHRAVIDLLLEEPRLVELYCRYRHDESAFGRTMRSLETREIDRSAGEIVGWVTRAGIAAGPHLAEIRLLAETHVAAMCAGLLALVERRLSDRDQVAVLLADSAAAGVRALLRRLGAARPAK